MNNHIRNEIKSWAKSICIALGVTLVVRTFIFAPYIVEGASMEPTLHNHEKIFVNKFNVTDNFKRGEIVIIKGMDVNYVKRIIALPGDTIEMRRINFILMVFNSRNPIFLKIVNKQNKRGAY